jgi:hypothetical protein
MQYDGGDVAVSGKVHHMPMHQTPWTEQHSCDACTVITLYRDIGYPELYQMADIQSATSQIHRGMHHMSWIQKTKTRMEYWHNVTGPRQAA